jgi:nicotinate-nucleotide adenylyltransferase
MIGLFGGAFDPPHLGHHELARRGIEEFGLHELQILVSSDPAHKEIECPLDVRIALAELAFADLQPAVVRPDPYRYTIDLLRAEPPTDAIFLMGADQYRAFSSWRAPEQVVALVRLGVATRAGVDRPAIPPEHEGRVTFFEIDSPPISSSELRARVRRGESVTGDVAQAVAAEIVRRGLYRSSRLH